MNSPRSLFQTSRAGFVSVVIVAGTLTSCVGYVDRPRSGIVMEPCVFEAQDDYIYYPGHDVYYGSHRRQYAYQERGGWVSHPAPPGVSLKVLLASPSVRMDFHDSPENHHAETVQKYPQNWAPPESPHGRPNDHKDVRHEGRKQTNGK